MSTPNLDRMKFMKLGTIPENSYISETGIELNKVLGEFTKDLNRSEAWDILRIIKLACTWKHEKGASDLDDIVSYANHLISYETNERHRLAACKKKLVARKIKTDPIDIPTVVDGFVFNLTGIDAWRTAYILERALRWRRTRSTKDLKDIRDQAKALSERTKLIERENHE